MIRREIQFPDTEPRWLLISQVEHARLSAALAERSIAKFGEQADSIVAPHELDLLRTELLAAILHHDDGWADWDDQRRIDPQHSRPTSFRELSLDQSMPIWTASIEAAAHHGNLAGWVVAGHFLALLEASEKPHADYAVKAWQEAMQERQRTWLADWQADQSAFHTAALANESLHCLQLFDVMSLWLCSACPGAKELASNQSKRYEFSVGEPLKTEFLYHPEQCRVIVDPWRFDVDCIAIGANGWSLAYRTPSVGNWSRSRIKAYPKTTSNCCFAL